MYWPAQFPAPALARAMLRPVGQYMRGVLPKIEALKLRGRGALAVFLPSRGFEGGSMLRIYLVAEALDALGWRSLVLLAR